LVGAAGGFLIWNWHRARIFLGDVGSIPIGVLCGALLVDLAVTQSLAAAVILPLYYLADATFTLAKRWLRGEKIWQAHRTHTYQRAALAAGSHSAIVLRIAACNGALIGCALLALSAPALALMLASAAVALLMWHLETIAAGQPRPAVTSF
jgi:UDP-N-acetylmuramyl pentapeptide phosphotransferase/UDP-N-acetylglucosamine-1-phosphate transferase